MGSYGEDRKLGAEMDGWTGANEEKPKHGAPVLALVDVSQMGYGFEALAWTIARWDEAKQWWAPVDVPNDSGRITPVGLLIRYWRELPAPPPNVKIVQA